MDIALHSEGSSGKSVVGEGKKTEMEDLTFYSWQCWRLKPVRQHIVFLMLDVF